MAIILILLLGLVLRLINLNQSLWLDEAVQAVTASGSFSGIFEELRGDFHPPLYHLLIWGWVHIFGDSEISLRLPSVIFGTLTIWVVYLIAKEIFPFSTSEVSPRQSRGPSTSEVVTAVLAGLFLATAPFHIYYSQEARPYALSTFLTALSLYFFIRLVASRLSANWRIAGYIFSTVLSLYSSYYFLFVILAQVVLVALAKKFSLYRYIFISLLFFTPWLPKLGEQIETGRQAVAFLPEWGRLVSVDFWKALPLTFIKFSIGRITIFNKFTYGAAAGFLFIFYSFVIIKGFLGVIHSRRVHSATPGVLRSDSPGVLSIRGVFFPITNHQLLITLWLIIPLLSAWLVSFFIPNYQPFRLLLALPAFYLLLAIGVISFESFEVQPPRRLNLLGNLLGTGVVVGILLVNFLSVGTYYLNPYFHREDWRGVTTYLGDRLGMSLVFLPSQTSNWPLRYYSLNLTKLITASRGIEKVSPATLESNLANKRLSNLDIYYIRYLVPLFDPQEKISAWLEKQGFVRIREISFNQILVWVYENRH